MDDRNDNCRVLLRKYHHSLHVWHTAYDDAASAFCKRGRVYGIVASAFSAVVATAAFASLSADTVPAWLKVGAGVFGTVAAVVAGLEATLKYPAMAIDYRAAANKYARVRHRAELLDLEPAVTESQLRGIATAWEAVAAEAPIISDRQYHRAEKRVNDAEKAELHDEARRLAAVQAAA